MTTVDVHPGTFNGTTAPADDAAEVMAAARDAQRAWAATTVAGRLRGLRNLRHAIAADPLRLADSIRSSARTPAERLASEVLPLADAIRFLERDAGRLLRPKRFGRRGAPLWLGRTRLEVRREPFGVVLVVGPANYPLLLAGVEAEQALAAGNAVLVKPAPGHSEPVRRLAGLAARAGTDPRLFAVVGEEPRRVEDLVAHGADKVVLTGSAATGEKVLGLLAGHVVPATMELSGHDAVVVGDDADVDLAARCIAYGLTLNGGTTCIAPRRVYVTESRAAQLEARLAAALEHAAAPPAVSILRVRDMGHALALANDCPYGLGATVFGSAVAARDVGARVNAGCVVVNDMIVPTADPRLPFGGRGRSGFGVTRGGEGLLEMTRVKAVVTRLGSFRPHLDPPHSLDADLFRHYLAAAHGPSLLDRARGAARVAYTLFRRAKTS